MKKIILLLILSILFCLQIVSAQLAYKITLSENNNILQLKQLNVVDVPSYKIAEQPIGEYMVVIGNKNTTTNYLDGTFITLPTTKFITIKDENDNLRTIEEHENETTIYIAYNQEATKLDIYTDNGTKIISKNFLKKQNKSPPSDVHKKENRTINNNNYSKKQQSNKENKKQNNKLEKIKKIIISITIILTLLLIITIIKKYKREKSEN